MQFSTFYFLLTTFDSKKEGFHEDSPLSILTKLIRSLDPTIVRMQSRYVLILSKLHTTVIDLI